MSARLPPEPDPPQAERLLRRSHSEADSGGFGDRRLVLDLRVGLGEVRVER
jgi:hypothetical protein